MKINMTIVSAIFKRDLRRYFTSPTGYVFITLFIFLSAWFAFWQEEFFQNNLANLSQLNAVFPFLLLLFIPALTMSVWADERKQGTDELLLTLPATDVEVVLGKYLAALGIYSASILLSLSHIFVLFWLGSPDIGLMFGNYFGYWLAGSALIAVSMLASLLTTNATVAFVLGALFCTVLVVPDRLFSVFGSGAEKFFFHLGVVEHFGDFARGVVSFSGLLYFLSVAGLFLFLNTVLISRRHWPAEADGYKMWVHHTSRIVALTIAIVSVNAILGRASIRLDVTGEGLHSLSEQTGKLIDELDPDRPVFIQAYISEDVPQQYVQTRENLISYLQEIDAKAGSKVNVVITDTEPYTEEAREAREKFGIQPRQVADPGSARASAAQIFMGLAITCGAEEQVTKFFERGLPVEYELARSIRVAANTERKKLGVVRTEAKVFGGFDFQSMRSQPSWQVVEELKKQYEVSEISADKPIEEELDGLLVILPSALPQEEMDNVKQYVLEGKPTVLLVDPVPVINIALAPQEEPGAGANPFQRNQGPPPKPKGNIQEFMNEIGVSWNSGQIVWDTYNPHPDLSQVPAEIIFVGEGNTNKEAFNPNSIASSGLQELVMIFPGALYEGVGKSTNFQPLLKTGYQSGTNPYQMAVQRSFFGSQLNPNMPHNNPTGTDYTLAAHISTGSASDDNKDEENTETEEENADAAPEDDGNLNVVVIADIDFISEQFFEIRKLGIQNLNFDNVAFFLNCVDLVMGDDSFIELRKKRVRHRTLEAVEDQVREFVEERVERENNAEAEAQQKLTQAQNRLDEAVNQVRNRTDLDEQSKTIQVRNLQEAENRKFEASKSRIEQEKAAAVDAGKEEMEGAIRNIQSTIKSIAVVIPPIPVFIIGVLIAIRRQRRETEGAALARRLRS